jgi:hypothetical protein
MSARSEEGTLGKRKAPGMESYVITIAIHTGDSNAFAGSPLVI